MMKAFKLHCIIIVFLIPIAVPVYSQNGTFTVLKVMGSVFCQRLQKDLQNGDKLMTQDKIRFSSPNSYLIVISPQDGRKVVKPASANTESELKSLLMDIVSLEKKHTANRGLDEGSKQVKAMKVLKMQLEADTLLILGSGKAIFINSDFALNDTAAVKARFKSGNSYTEKPVSSGSVLDLSRSSVFGTQPLAKVQLIYLPNVKKNIFDSPPESLGSFVPRYFDNEAALVKEIQVIHSAYAGKSREIILAEIKKYIEDEYGSVLEENLVQWLAESNLLKP